MNLPASSRPLAFESADGLISLARNVILAFEHAKCLKYKVKAESPDGRRSAAEGFKTPNSEPMSPTAQFALFGFGAWWRLAWEHRAKF